MPTEFNSDINADFYNRLASGIQKQGGYDVGQARSEALARGLTGDPFEASLTGMARANTSNKLADMGADMDYRLAGMNREERMLGEGRQYQTAERLGQQQWQSGESAAMRSFNERMARQQNDWASDAASTANRRSTQSALWQLPIQLGATAAGYAAGGPIGAKMASSATGSMMAGNPGGSYGGYA